MGAVRDRRARRGSYQPDRGRPPPGERPELRRIQLVAPTSTDERLALAARETDGWLYLVTLDGHDRRPRRAVELACRPRPPRPRARRHACTPGSGPGRPSTPARPRSSPTVSSSVPPPCRRPRTGHLRRVRRAPRCARPSTSQGRASPSPSGGGRLAPSAHGGLRPARATRRVAPTPRSLPYSSSTNDEHVYLILGRSSLRRSAPAVPDPRAAHVPQRRVRAFQALLDRVRNSASRSS